MYYNNSSLNLRKSLVSEPIFALWFKKIDSVMTFASLLSYPYNSFLPSQMFCTKTFWGFSLTSWCLLSPMPCPLLPFLNFFFLIFVWCFTSFIYHFLLHWKSPKGRKGLGSGNLKVLWDFLNDKTRPKDPCPWLWSRK